jgi:LysR family hydrogen peroxide-inducible transcriptional activator
VRSEIRPPEELHVTSIVGERMERLHALAWRPTSPSHALFQALADDIRRVAVERLSQEVAPVR